MDKFKRIYERAKECNWHAIGSIAIWCFLIWGYFALAERNCINKNGVWDRETKNCEWRARK